MALYIRSTTRAAVSSGTGKRRLQPDMARIDIPEGEGGDAAQVWLLRPDMAGAVGKMVEAAYHRSRLPVRERELARMRIAQLNDCPI